jgi:all-trans-retinol 13,14-reductase
VLSTINPTLLPQLLPERTLRPAYVKRLRNLRQTTSAYILFARGCGAAELQSSNLFVQQRAGLFSTATDRPLEERSFYLTATGGEATERGSAIVGIVPAAFSEVVEFTSEAQRQGTAYAALKDSLSERLRQMFLAGCPDLVELDVLELATPLTLRDYSLAPDGAIYGVGRFVGQYNPHPVTRLPGLFLSGQAIAAPGLLGAVVAAYLTCGTILGHDNLRKEIRTCR